MRENRLAHILHSRICLFLAPSFPPPPSYALPSCRNGLGGGRGSVATLEEASCRVCVATLRYCSVWNSRQWLESRAVVYPRLPYPFPLFLFSRLSIESIYLQARTRVVVIDAGVTLRRAKDDPLRSNLVISDNPSNVYSSASFFGVDCCGRFRASFIGV